MNLIIKPPKLLTMNLKSQLRYFLELRGLTAAELSRRSKVSAQTISIWLSGGPVRDVSKAKAVADVLGTTLDNLLYGSGLPTDNDRAVEISQILNEGGAIKGLFEISIKMVKRK